MIELLKIKSDPLFLKKAEKKDKNRKRKGDWERTNVKEIKKRKNSRKAQKKLLESRSKLSNEKYASEIASLNIGKNSWEVKGQTMKAMWKELELSQQEVDKEGNKKALKADGKRDRLKFIVDHYGGLAPEQIQRCKIANPTWFSTPKKGNSKKN